jgi:hypothetical protein
LRWLLCPPSCLAKGFYQGLNYPFETNVGCLIGLTNHAKPHNL